MRKAGLGLIAAVLTAWSGMSLAQGDDISEGRAMIQAGREEMIRAELPLTGAEAAAFWPIYADYQAETQAIADRYAKVIVEFVERYDNVDFSDEYAASLLDDYLGIRQDLLDVRKAYLPKFMAVMPALKVALLYQLENKVSAEIDAQLAMALPLIDPS
jgi:hypothetical protein